MSWHIMIIIIIVLIIFNKGNMHNILLLKEIDCARLRESDIHTINPKNPAPQYQSIDTKKRKEKIVEDYSRDNKKSI